MIDGVAFSLNKGLTGFGSDNSRGQFDSIQLRVLPPTLTLDRQETFADGVADWLAPEIGTASITGAGTTARYDVTAAGRLAIWRSCWPTSASRSRTTPTCRSTPS